MLRNSVTGKGPVIDTTSYVDSEAIIIGHVVIGPNCFVGPGVVIRADCFSDEDTEPGIVVGAHCVIQDTAVMHAHPGQALHIGDDTIINHGAVLHAPCRLGCNCFIGCRTVITIAELGDHVFVRTNAVVERVVVPPERFIDTGCIIRSGDDVSRLRPISDTEREFFAKAVEFTRDYPVRYKFSIEK